jgi:hypothetical protein
MLVADKLIGVRFVLFAFVGGIGLVTQMLTLRFAFTVAGWPSIRRRPQLLLWR